MTAPEQRAWLWLRNGHALLCLGLAVQLLSLVLRLAFAVHRLSTLNGLGIQLVCVGVHQNMQFQKGAGQTEPRFRVAAVIGIGLSLLGIALEYALYDQIRSYTLASLVYAPSMMGLVLTIGAFIWSRLKPVSSARSS